MERSVIGRFGLNDDAVFAVSKNAGNRIGFERANHVWLLHLKAR
jgi:hypothetical protein